MTVPSQFLSPKACLPSTFLSPKAHCHLTLLSPSRRKERPAGPGPQHTTGMPRPSCVFNLRYQSPSPSSTPLLPQSQSLLIQSAILKPLLPPPSPPPIPCVFNLRFLWDSIIHAPLPIPSSAAFSIWYFNSAPRFMLSCHAFSICISIPYLPSIRFQPSAPPLRFQFAI